MSSKEQDESAKIVDKFFDERQKSKISKKLIGKVLGINDEVKDLPKNSDIVGKSVEIVGEDMKSVSNARTEILKIINTPKKVNNRSEKPIKNACRSII